MQKLIWTNANGDSVDLTSGNYGITKWNGFSNTSLSIQSQQVPFHDGSVYLDALLEQRELSVTLAMDAKGDLEKRYRLRRELIEILNPKLGEGYLIYRNDFTAKRIKCIPQVPLFENNNSNDSGSPKASLSWTACDPYWEDLEEMAISLIGGDRTVIENNGDVPCGVEIDLFMTNATNPQIKSFTTGKRIKLNGEFEKNVYINTKFGKKQILEEEMNSVIANFGFPINGIAYSKELGIMVGVCTTHKIIYSYDGENWLFANVINTQEADYELKSVVFIQEKQKFYATGGWGSVFISSDGINWTKSALGFVLNANSITYSESLDLFCVVGESGFIYTGQDEITWVRRTTNVNEDLLDVAWSDELNIFVVVGKRGRILTSPDGINWTERTSGTSLDLSTVIYIKELELFVVGGFLLSSDGINWNNRYANFGVNFTKMKYDEKTGEIIGTNAQLSTRGFYTSENGVDWIKKCSQSAYDFAYNVDLGLFVCVNSSDIYFSSDLKEWELKKDGIVSDSGMSFLYYSDADDLLLSNDNNYLVISSDKGSSWMKTLLFNGGGYFSYVNNTYVLSCVGKIYTSPDGINWTMALDNPTYHINTITYSKKLDLYVGISSGFTIVKGQTIGELTSIDYVLPHSCEKIIYSESLGIFCAVGFEGLIITSPDGINWTERTSGVNTNLKSVVYSESLGIFCAVGVNTVLTSSDGITWILRDIGSEGSIPLNDVIFSESLGIFFTVSLSALYVSSDGKKWIYIDNSVNPMAYLSFSEKNKQLYVGGSVLLFAGQGRFYLVTIFNFELGENLIDKLSFDSDMTFDLVSGKNEILLNSSIGNINGSVRYRQKYIGV